MALEHTHTHTKTALTCATHNGARGQVRYLPVLLSILFSEARLLTEPEAGAPGIHLSQCDSPEVTDVYPLGVHLSQSDSPEDTDVYLLGVQAQVLRSLQQALYPLSRFPSLSVHLLMCSYPYPEVLLRAHLYSVLIANIAIDLSLQTLESSQDFPRHRQGQILIGKTLRHHLFEYIDTCTD